MAAARHTHSERHRSTHGEICNEAEQYRHDWELSQGPGFDWDDEAKRAYRKHRRSLLIEERPRSMPGGAFILDEPEDIPPVWGDGDHVLWAEGEGLMLVGPQGVGKTTVAQQVVRARIGIGDNHVLGYPVVPTEGRTLYIAADRPRQAARSFHRMVRETDREALDRRLEVWRGPLPFNLVTDDDALVEFVMGYEDVTTVVMDSLKDLASGLAEDKVGARVNTETQKVIAQGVEYVALHHQRKGNGDNKNPIRLDDVFGSTWLTAGMGSVVLIWGEPGGDRVQVIHLKQPAETVPMFWAQHHHAEGLTLPMSGKPIAAMSRAEKFEALLEVIRGAGAAGVGLGGLTHAVEEVDYDNAAAFRAAKERTRRLLDKLEDEEPSITTSEGGKGGNGGGGTEARWYWHG